VVVSIATRASSTLDSIARINARKFVADLLLRLKDYKPALVVFDMAFASKSDDPAGDELCRKP